MQKQQASRCKASPAQLSYLADYMKNHASMASGLSQTLQGRATLDASWQSLTMKLNPLGGPIKSVAKWKQAWRDLRNNVKRKVTHNKNEYRGYGPGSTGNGPPTIKDLTPVEEEVLSVMGPVAVYGMEEIECTEIIQDTESPAGPSQSPAPAPPQPVPSSPAPPEPTPSASGVLPGPSGAAAPFQKRKRTRVVARHDNFDSKILKIEEEKLQLTRESNEIEREKNSILNRHYGLTAS